MLRQRTFFEVVGGWVSRKPATRWRHLRPGKDNAYDWHIVRVVDAVSTTVTVAQGGPSLIRYQVILSVVPKQKKKKKRDAIRTAVARALHKGLVKALLQCLYQTFVFSIVIK